MQVCANLTRWIGDQQESEGVPVGEDVYIILRLDGRVRRSGRVSAISEKLTIINNLYTLIYANAFAGYTWLGENCAGAAANGCNFKQIGKMTSSTVLHTNLLEFGGCNFILFYSFTNAIFICATKLSTVYIHSSTITTVDSCKVNVTTEIDKYNLQLQRQMLQLQHCILPYPASITSIFCPVLAIKLNLFGDSNSFDRKISYYNSYGESIF